MPVYDQGCNTESGSVIVIANPNAGPSGSQSALEGLLSHAFEGNFQITETTDAEHAAETVCATVGDAGLVVAAGGDGTIQAVINGLMKCERRPPLALIPTGTANNLCRSLGIPLDRAAAVNLLRTGEARTIDLVHIECPNEQRYFAGVASAGNTDRVIDRLQKDDKQTWGPWCYVRAALPVMVDLCSFKAILTFDDEQPVEMNLWNLLIANGRFAAGGLQVSPRSLMQDGRIDVIMIADGTPLDLAALTAEFWTGDYLEDERVTCRRATKLKVEATPEFRFLTDGELIAGQPFAFTVMPDGLSVIVPRDQPI